MPSGYTRLEAFSRVRDREPLATESGHELRCASSLSAGVTPFYAVRSAVVNVPGGNP